jgi:hypothetical protein
MLNVNATLPSFRRYIVAVAVPPGLKVPQLTLESPAVQPLSEYTPSSTDGGGVTILTVPVLETVRVTMSAPMVLMTKTKLTTANAKTVPTVALRMAIMFHSNKRGI